MNRVAATLKSPPPHAAHVERAWADFVAKRLSPADAAGLQGPFQPIVFFDDARIQRRTAWRPVCDRNVFSATVWQLYDPDADGHVQLFRVERAPLFLPLAIFRRAAAGAGAVVGDDASGIFVLGRHYADTVESERSSDFKIFKPRCVDMSAFSVVPLGELARPLWPLPFYADAAPAADAPVPSAESVLAAGGGDRHFLPFYRHQDAEHDRVHRDHRHGPRHALVLRAFFLPVAHHGGSVFAHFAQPLLQRHALRVEGGSAGRSASASGVCRHLTKAREAAAAAGVKSMKKSPPGSPFSAKT